MKKDNESNYFLWLRAKDDMAEAVERLERELEVNKIFLKAAESELAKYPKPKPKENCTSSIPAAN